MVIPFTHRNQHAELTPNASAVNGGWSEGLATWGVMALKAAGDSGAATAREVRKDPEDPVLC